MSGTSPLASHPSDPPAPSAASLDWALFLRQVQGVMRLELRRQFFARRALVPLLLAFAPVGLAAIWAVSPIPEKMGSGPMVITPVFAAFFRGYLSTSLFLSCLIVFSGLFRNEILD
ncbi:MAG: hypothetical protein MI919_35620, partial [Holophagales bacterium]|nr:hypothetical protein [Holophagales bacterium]